MTWLVNHATYLVCIVVGLSVIPRTLLWLWDDHAKRKAAREYEHHLAEAAKRRGIL